MTRVDEENDFDLLQLRNVHRKESCEETCLRYVYPAPFSRHQIG